MKLTIPFAVVITMVTSGVPEGYLDDPQAYAALNPSTVGLCGGADRAATDAALSGLEGESLAEFHRLWDSDFQAEHFLPRNHAELLALNLTTATVERLWQTIVRCALARIISSTTFLPGVAPLEARSDAEIHDIARMFAAAVTEDLPKYNVGLYKVFPAWTMEELSVLLGSATLAIRIIVGNGLRDWFNWDHVPHDPERFAPIAYQEVHRAQTFTWLDIYAWPAFKRPIEDKAEETYWVISEVLKQTRFGEMRFPIEEATMAKLVPLMNITRKLMLDNLDLLMGPDENHRLFHIVFGLPEPPTDGGYLRVSEDRWRWRADMREIAAKIRRAGPQETRVPESTQISAGASAST